MRLLVLTQTFDDGDSVLGFFIGWIERLAARATSVQVVAQTVGGSRPAAANVRVYSMEKERGAGRVARHLRLQRLLGRLLLRERSADVVLCHMVPAYALAALPAARLAGAPLFLWYTHGKSSRPLALADRVVNGILTASKEGFPFASRKLTAIGHGIDTRKFCPRALPTGNGRVVLSLGRLSPVKAHEVPIRALAVARREHGLTDVELHIVGDVPLPAQRPYAAELVRVSAAEGVEEHVHFHDGVPHAQVDRHLAACDVLVSASNTGSLDKVVLEAMACGRPVLVSSDAYRDEIAGFEDLLAFRPGDAADLAAKLAVLLRADRGRLESIGRRLGERVRQRHDLDRLVERMMELFRDAL